MNNTKELSTKQAKQKLLEDIAEWYGYSLDIEEDGSVRMTQEKTMSFDSMDSALAGWLPTLN